MADEEILASFMQATGLGYDEAFTRLASAGGHLGRAYSAFKNIEAGPSGTSRTPPPSPHVVSNSEWEDDDDDVPPVRAPRRSRWDVEAGDDGSGSRSSRPDRPRRRDGGDDDREADRDRSRSRRRRFRGDSDEEEEAKGNNRRRQNNPAELKSSSTKTRDADDGGKRSSHRRRRRREDREVGDHDRSRRRRRSRNDIFSDSEEEEVKRNSDGRRRRLNPADVTSSEKKVDGNSSLLPGDHMSTDDYLKDLDGLLEEDEALPPPLQWPTDKTTKHKLAYKGGFHAAKAHAAGRRRWLLVNVRGPEPASFKQSRDVWGADLVSQGVLKDRFVLWQADAHAAGDEGEEANKVLCYYKLPGQKLPAVVVVDPVTGQAMEKMHGSDACDLNDFLLSVGPYTDIEPLRPVVRPNNSSVVPAAGVQSDKKPSPSSPAPQHAPTVSKPAATSPPGPAEHASTLVPKPPAEPPVAAAPTATAGGQIQPAVAVGKACKIRVRLPDGRAVTKEFGSQCALAALFEYCRAELGAGAAAEKPFRLMRFVVGGAREEIGDQNASFESLRLHLSNVSVELG